MSHPTDQRGGRIDGERDAVSRSAPACREGAARRLQLAGHAIVTDFPFTELAPADGAADRAIGVMSSGEPFPPLGTLLRKRSHPQFGQD